MSFARSTAPMEYTVYIYAAEQPVEHLEDFRCPRCGRIVFRSNSNKIFLTNRYGANIKDLPPHSNFIEHKCHSCKATYHILFQ